MLRVLLLVFLLEAPVVWSAHYKGGTVTWKPTNPNATGSPIEILIAEKHSFTLTGRYFCSKAIIDGQLAYFDAVSPLVAPDLSCQSTAALCTASSFTTIQHSLLCTDYSTQLDSSSGAYYTKQYLSSTTNIDIAYSSAAWASVIRTSTGAAASSWYVGTHIGLSGVYPINSSPGKNIFLLCLFYNRIIVTGSLPIIRVIENQVATIQIPAADWDIGQTLSCRFASDSYGYGSECLDICNNMPGATISAR